jgi:molybdopterin converting factor subunit 1
MRITVRLFARLRDVAGAAELAREAAAGATIRDVWHGLVAEYPAFEAYSTSISAARNVEYAPMDTAVSEGDEVAFLPPVSGGSA